MKNEYFSPAKYSSLTKFLKVTAYLNHFIYKWERRIGPLLVEEIEYYPRGIISSRSCSSQVETTYFK